VRREPFEAVVERHGAAVLRVCRAVCGPAADDAWSETFLSALRAYPDLPAGSNVEAWLVTIAHRRSVDQLRAAARRPLATDAVPDALSTLGLPEAAHEADDGLWAALETLPDKQRRCVTYHHVVGLPYAEVAALIGGTPAAARRAASDGVAALRARLGPQPAGGRR
jgi:RNA polymerase sigma factor (sigma-70 family)